MPRPDLPIIACIGMGLACLSCTSTAPQPAPALTDWRGHRGLWICTPVVEAFVSIAPRTRVLAMRRPGEQSPLRVADDAYTGVRTQVICWDAGKHDMDPALQPGRFVSAASDHAVVEAQSDQPSPCRIRVTVALAHDRPVATITHRLTNTGARPTDLALWVINSFPRQGRTIVPFGMGPRPHRTMTVFSWSGWPQPGIEEGRRAMTVDFDQPVTGGVMKFGLRSDAGWAAWIGPKVAMVSTVAFAPHQFYPDGGSNITVFQADNPDHPWAETEHVGPIQTLGPGRSVELTQTITLLPAPGGPRPQSADEWMSWIAEGLGR